jgi:hypothetical protein
VLEVKVRNLVGNGKASIRRPNLTWINYLFDAGDGVYTFTYTGVVHDMHVGANNDSTAQMDFDYISLRKQ